MNGQITLDEGDQSFIDQLDAALTELINKYCTGGDRRFSIGVELMLQHLTTMVSLSAINRTARDRVEIDRLYDRFKDDVHNFTGQIRALLSQLDTAIAAPLEIERLKKLLESQEKEENVLVIPTARLNELIGLLVTPRSGIFNLSVTMSELLSDDAWQFMPESKAETDETFRQIIPYIVLVSQDMTRVFQYTRGKGGGEKRLHAKKSIGVGGHINSMDGATPLAAYQAGLARELSEELNLGESFAIDAEVSELLEPPLIHLILDNSSEVGRVHVGCLHVMNVNEAEISAREEELEFAGFKSLDELLATRDSMENWSQFALNFLAAYR